MTLMPTKIKKKNGKCTFDEEKTEKIGIIESKICHTLFRRNKSFPIFAARKRELSSVGSEHRPYKAGVVGSSPTVPTKIS